VRRTGRRRTHTQAPAVPLVCVSSCVCACARAAPGRVARLRRRVRPCSSGGLGVFYRIADLRKLINTEYLHDLRSSSIQSICTSYLYRSSRQIVCTKPSMCADTEYRVPAQNHPCRASIQIVWSSLHTLSTDRMSAQIVHTDCLHDTIHATYPHRLQAVNIDDSFRASVPPDQTRPGGPAPPPPHRVSMHPPDASYTSPEPYTSVPVRD
jgi:hypothetical protein